MRGIPLVQVGSCGLTLALSLRRRFNVRTGPPRSRHLMTGVHTIADVMCQFCDSVLGWKYVRERVRDDPQWI